MQEQMEKLEQQKPLEVVELDEVMLDNVVGGFAVPLEDANNCNCINNKC